MNWFEIENINDIDSPSIMLYKDRLLHNIHTMLDMVNGDASRLIPHIKTSKMPEVIQHMMVLGVKNFKAATIAEAEIAAAAGAHNVLIAHQLTGPKTARFLALIAHFPGTKFATVLDNMHSAWQLNRLAEDRHLDIDFFIDINNGMNRSGITTGPELDNFIVQIPSYRSLSFKGLHVYDGHIRDRDFETRKQKVEADFHEVNALFTKLKRAFPELQLICGGTPTFTCHLSDESRICSPGTCLLWDWGYGEMLKEQEFKHAAVLVSRVISKPAEDIVTIDLGHKSVAAENPIHQRIKFLNLQDYELLSQSEEHGVLRVKNRNSLKVGDVLYGIPYHICPTINLHDEVSVITNHRKITSWEISARRRKISI